MTTPKTSPRWAGTILAAVVWAVLLVAQVHAVTIGVGDIVVLGVASDNTNGFGTADGFSWATLIDLDAGDQIFFTDSSWNIQVAGGFNGVESLIQYSVPGGGIQAGTIFLADLQSLPADHATVGSPQTGIQNPMALSSSGDQIAVFTGSVVTPTFIFAVNTDQTQWTGSSSASATSSRSDLYPGLTDGLNAVAVGAGPNPGQEFDNSYFTGSTTAAGKATWLARISDQSNWTGENVGQQVNAMDMTAGLGADGTLNVTPAEPVPVPATILLLSSGLVGLIAFRRKFKK